jgi:hypothetical protein
MLKPIKIPPQGGKARLLLLDSQDEAGEPRAALIRPGRLPIVYANLTRAVDALRQELSA